MKLKDSTLNILKNFALINQGLVVNKDKAVYTKTVDNSLLARCEFDELTEAFAIYDIAGYLSSLSLFDSPDIKFHTKYMGISDSHQKAKKHYSSIDVIDYPEDEQIEIIEGISAGSTVDFILSGEQLAKIVKASAVMKCDTLSFVSDGQFIKAGLSDSTNTTADTFEIDLGLCESEFNVELYVNQLKCLPASYEISILEDRELPDGNLITLVLFYNETLKLTYWIATAV